MTENEKNGGLSEEEILAIEAELYESWLNYIASVPDEDEWR